ncbi:MAG: cob(I)yrinic acid a,c-diamide adenosyltransferase [Patescibacteria group bacterium]
MNTHPWYSGKGDSGTSTLFGSKDRIPKNDVRFEALGSIDELNSLLGVCRAVVVEQKYTAPLRKTIETIQEYLFTAQAELAGASPHLEEHHVVWLNNTIETYASAVQKPNSFIIPGATIASGMLDYARTVARRAERAVAVCAEQHTVSPHLQTFINRLSSMFFILARAAAKLASVDERAPQYL